LHGGVILRNVDYRKKAVAENNAHGVEGKEPSMKSMKVI